MAGILFDNSTVGLINELTSSSVHYLLNSTGYGAGANNTTLVDPCGYLHRVPDYTTSMIQKYAPYVVLTFCIVAFLFGVLGNGTLLVIIIREKEMRRVTNIYLFSIALGDFLFIIVYTPFTFFVHGLSDWPFDEATCKFITFLQTFSMGLSVFTLKVISWDQYRTSQHTTRSRASTLKTTVQIASAVWVAAIAFGVIDLVAATLLPMHPNCSNLVYCDSQWGEPFAKFRTILDFMVFCLIPAVIMLYFYSSMACRNQGAGCNTTNTKGCSDQSTSLNTNIISSSDDHVNLRNHINNCSDQNVNLNAKTIKNRDTNTSHKREMRISVGLAVLFLFCVLPTQIYKFWFYFSPFGTFNNFWYIFKVFSSVTTFANSCINPIALCILSDQFRKYYKKYLCCIRDNLSL